MISREWKKRKNNQKQYQNRTIQISTNRKLYYTKNKANILKYQKSLFKRDNYIKIIHKGSTLKFYFLSIVSIMVLLLAELQTKRSRPWVALNRQRFG
jgi:hypothetical protein